MKLKLINHACCKITFGDLTILCDPWVEGSAFNCGWDLLIETPESFDEIMQDVNFIWLSHEHPDHFSVPFISRVAKEYGDRVTILFQSTRDCRVYNFCTSAGLKVQELPHGKPVVLKDNVTVTCMPTDFYDSWLYITDGQNSVLNLNDCHTRSQRDLEKIARIAPAPTVLLSQFSYASWKGGRDNADFRAAAAAQKLDTLARQVRFLKPRFTVPFASLIYFSNEENSYLNDCINTPAKASLVIQEAGSLLAILYPGDCWHIEDDLVLQNRQALMRYASRYDSLPDLPLRKAGDSVGFDELRRAFGKYQENIFAKNSRLLILLLRKFAIMQAFQPLIVDLYDLGIFVSVSVTDGMHEVSKRVRADVRMHSSSLLFIFKNEFGFDTLMVNGRFECQPEGFAKMTKAFAVGSLNAMGLSLSPALAFDLRFIFLLLGILNGVLSKLNNKQPHNVLPAVEPVKASSGSQAAQRLPRDEIARR